MKKNTSQNLLLGIFVITGLVIFILAVYFIGNNQNIFGNTTRITSVFKNVNGLQLGNNVRFAGVNVGTVRGIKIMNDTSIVVDMIIDEKTIGLIKHNSLASISSDGLVGSMVIDIIPGETYSSIPVKEGDTIRSLSKIATADMLNTLNTTNINAALLTTDLLKITNAINEGEGILGELLKDRDMAINLKESLANLHSTTDAAKKSMNQINHLLAQINYNESLAGILLTDTTAAGQISAMINNLEQTTSQINRITANLDGYTEELIEGEGALKLVTQDTSFVRNLENTMQNVEEASARFNENMEALRNNFLLRGYFRRLERQERRALENN